MPTDLPSMLYVLGRILLGGLFVAGGVEHFFIMPVLMAVMTQRGVPAAKAVMLVGSVWQIVLGVLLILGVLVVPAAIGLIVFTLAASIMFLNFWDKAGPERASLQNAFLCNIAIMGALLMAAANAM